MNFLELLAVSVYAAESVISPVPDTTEPITVEIVRPEVSFGELTKAPEPTPLPTPEVLGAVTQLPAEPVPAARKNHFTIGLLGDSMVDTLGPDFPNLTSKLSSAYPGTRFTVLNYGAGGTNIDSGAERLTHDSTYLGVPRPSLVSQSPDVVVVESFGYNPYSDINGYLDRHWLALSRVVDTIRQQLPNTKVVIAATIAPDGNTFGDGAPGISFSPEDKTQRTTIIKEYLDNAVRFAKSERLPLADAYHASVDGSGNGKPVYVNAGDHIHYSDAGRELFARVLADTIIDNRLLE